MWVLIFLALQFISAGYIDTPAFADDYDMPDYDEGSSFPPQPIDEKSYTPTIDFNPTYSLIAPIDTTPIDTTLSTLQTYSFNDIGNQMPAIDTTLPNLQLQSPSFNYPTAQTTPAYSLLSTDITLPATIPNLLLAYSKDIGNQAQEYQILYYYPNSNITMAPTIPQVNIANNQDFITTPIEETIQVFDDGSRLYSINGIVKRLIIPSDTGSLFVYEPPNNRGRFVRSDGLVIGDFGDIEGEVNVFNVKDYSKLADNADTLTHGLNALMDITKQAPPSIYLDGFKIADRGVPFNIIGIVQRLDEVSNLPEIGVEERNKSFTRILLSDPGIRDTIKSMYDLIRNEELKDKTVDELIKQRQIDFEEFRSLSTRMGINRDISRDITWRDFFQYVHQNTELLKQQLPDHYREFEGLVNDKERFANSLAIVNLIQLHPSISTGVNDLGDCVWQTFLGGIALSGNEEAGIEGLTPGFLKGSIYFNAINYGPNHRAMLVSPDNFKDVGDSVSNLPILTLDFAQRRGNEENPAQIFYTPEYYQTAQLPLTKPYLYEGDNLVYTSAYTPETSGLTYHAGLVNNLFLYFLGPERAYKIKKENFLQR